MENDDFFWCGDELRLLSINNSSFSQWFSYKRVRISCKKVRARNTHIYGILREREREKSSSIKLTFIVESSISEGNLWQKCNNLHNDKSKQKKKKKNYKNKLRSRARYEYANLVTKYEKQMQINLS